MPNATSAVAYSISLTKSRLTSGTTVTIARRDMSADLTIKVVDLISNTCVECNRTFDMTNEIESAEWSFGHDCEV